jgi:hypothetical protein
MEIMTAFWDIALCNFVGTDLRSRGAHRLMMKAARTSETSVNFYENTGRNIPEGCHLQSGKEPVRYPVQNNWQPRKVSQ